MPKDSIALIGFMATGKTTIGKALVEYLGNDYRFIETDQLIIQIAGKPIPRIFSEDGEDKFRECEISVCENLSKLQRVIISCGGGVVVNWVNIENLRKNCHIVLLNATPEEIFKRLLKNGKETRPIIDKKDPKGEIMKILNIRKPYYEKAAELVIDTTDKKIQNIVREIAIKTFLKT
ncbi:MAG: shikimate kinase [Promethearchaeota archaeon Loki_b32]|nr:MAG: shikimate kinase [Candidatus Lokiarchaeota archaeon Loki_b32]